MRQLGMLDADFLHKEAAHFDSNITLIKIYDQSTAPAGKVRLKSLLAHVESRLDLSPIFRSKLQPTPLGVDLPLWEIYVMEGQDGFHDLPAGSFALLVEVHYAAVDVDRGADISTLLHDTTQRSPDYGPPTPWFPRSPPGSLALLARSAFTSIASPFLTVRKLSRFVTRRAQAAHSRPCTLKKTRSGRRSPRD